MRVPVRSDGSAAGGCRPDTGGGVVRGAPDLVRAVRSAKWVTGRVCRADAGRMWPHPGRVGPLLPPVAVSRRCRG